MLRKQRRLVDTLQSSNYLLQRGADVNVEDNMDLQTAIFSGHGEIIRLLLHNAAETNAEGTEYSSALQQGSPGEHMQSFNC
jgi:ankyrin repeat protein